MLPPVLEALILLDEVSSFGGEPTPTVRVITNKNARRALANPISSGCNVIRVIYPAAP